MKSYLLDSSVIIDYLRGKNSAVDLLNSINEELCSSSVCLAELYEGIYRVQNKLSMEKIVLDFFRSLSKLYPVDEKIAKKFGEIRAKLKLQGTIIEDIDIFIAATCLVYGLILITNNVKHFSRIKNLNILDADR
jgi:tRNA(fMet)-specific endonuclease VapC